MVNFVSIWYSDMYRAEMTAPPICPNIRPQEWFMRPDQFVYCDGECGLVVTLCTCADPADEESGQGVES